MTSAPNVVADDVERIGQAFDHGIPYRTRIGESVDQQDRWPTLFPGFGHREGDTPRSVDPPRRAHGAKPKQGPSKLSNSTEDG